MSYSKKQKKKKRGGEGGVSNLQILFRGVGGDEIYPVLFYQNIFILNFLPNSKMLIRGGRGETGYTVSPKLYQYPKSYFMRGG